MEAIGRLSKEEVEVHEEVPRSLSPLPRQNATDAKITSILDACKWKDIERLTLLATNEGGFISDHVRRQACSCY